jgi:hypothetical protein
VAAHHRGDARHDRSGTGRRRRDDGADGINGLYVATAVLLGHTTVFAVDDRIEAATFRDVEGRRPPGATAPTLPFGPAAGTEAAAGDGTAPPLDEAARDVQLNDDEGDGDA